MNEFLFNKDFIKNFNWNEELISFFQHKQNI